MIMAVAQPTPLSTMIAIGGQLTWQAPHSMQVGRVGHFDGFPIRFEDAMRADSNAHTTVDAQVAVVTQCVRTIGVEHHSLPTHR